MKDPVTSDSLVDHSSRLGRRHWRRESHTSHVWLVEWLGHWWWVTDGRSWRRAAGRSQLAMSMHISDTYLGAMLPRQQQTVAATLNW